MVWFLIIVLALVALGITTMFVLAVAAGIDEFGERPYPDRDGGPAGERRLHNVARDSFGAMPDEAQSHERAGK
jgi:hypothetical protein